MNNKKVILGVISVIAVILPATTLANGNSGWQVNGPHYNLNIIGTNNVGNVGISDGHTMFVNLDGSTKIVMTQDANGTFQVTDRNGLDGSAIFNIAPGHYNIYARALGKPNGKVDINAYGLFNDTATGETLIPLGYVDLTRSKGKPQAVNINSLFYVNVTICTAVNSTGTCTQQTTYNDTWVFDITELLQYYWNYNNSGLKLLQVRLYPCTLDATGTASDYCRWGDGSPIISTKQTVVPII